MEKGHRYPTQIGAYLGRLPGERADRSGILRVSTDAVIGSIRPDAIVYGQPLKSELAQIGPQARRQHSRHGRAPNRLVVVSAVELHD